MIDDVEFEDGSANQIQLGGPSIFAYTGVKLWTDACQLVCNVGLDFYDYFGQWIKDNKVITDSIYVTSESTTRHYLKYLKNGNYTYQSAKSEMSNSELHTNLGFMKIRPEQIGEVTEGKNIKGLYLAQSSDYVFWEKLGKIKQRDGFKIMWEIELNACTPKRYKQLDHALSFVDIFSINIFEASKLFETEDEKEIIKKLQQLKVDYTLFRVGARGLYTVSKDEVYFHPSIKTGNIKDPTGSGNSSTGSALYSYAEENDSVMIGTMANVASSINIDYFGAIENMSARRSEANDLAKEVYDNYE